VMGKVGSEPLFGDVNWPKDGINILFLVIALVLFWAVYRLLLPWWIVGRQLGRISRSVTKKLERKNAAAVGDLEKKWDKGIKANADDIDHLSVELRDCSGTVEQLRKEIASLTKRE
jgi:hypothetical protein